MGTSSQSVLGPATDLIPVTIPGPVSAQCRTILSNASGTISGTTRSGNVRNNVYLIAGYNPAMWAEITAITGATQIWEVI